MPDLPFHLVFASLSLPTLVIIENFKLSDSQVSSESVIFHFPAGLCLHARCSEPQSLSFSSSIWKFICTSRNILSCWSVLIWWQSFLLFYSLLQVEFHPSIVVTSIQEEEHICHFKSEFCQLSSMPMTHKSHSILKLFLECWAHTSKKFFFLSIFIWTSPKISFKFNMPQSEVFFLLPNSHFLLLWVNSGNTFPQVVQLRTWMSFLPFSSHSPSFQSFKEFFQLHLLISLKYVPTVSSDMDN